jgi:betaine-homocysteine S-methyltransferase
MRQGNHVLRPVYLGAEVVGVNCLFDPTISLNTIGMMKDALQIANLKPYLMCQPIAYHTPDVDHRGLSEMPEYPFGIACCLVKCQCQC